MQVVEARRRQAFAYWMRTGRWPTARTADGIELKFNPNHDPDTGRFTSGDGDQRWGDGGFTGGGGGSFGGAGASGSGWSDQPKKRAAKPSPAHPPSHPSDAANAAHETAQRPETQPRSSTRAGEESYRHVERNGYAYDIDPDDRTRRVSGYLTLGDGGRSRTAQAQAGGADRLPSDDGGHYIAVRFNGPKEAFNHFAQDSTVNRGEYRMLEDQWAHAKKSGETVRVKISPAYAGSSTRPTRINVWFWINGHRQSQIFPKSSKGS